MHGKFAARAAESYPMTRVLAAPDAPPRRKSLTFHASLEDRPPAAWAGEVESHLLLGFSRRLLRLGALLLLMGLLIGLAIPALAVPRLGVSAHLNAVVGAVFLFALGLLWPQLRLGARGSIVAFWLAPYSFFTASLTPLLGGIWGAGGAMLPIAGGTARGSAFQEGVIAVGLVSAGAAILVVCVLLLVGLRGSPCEP